MKLYFTPGTCSLAAHIALREAGLTFDLEQVDLAAKTTRSGEDYAKVNPKGYVPALQLDDGQILTEASVVVQYIADRRPEANLMPRPGSLERYRAQEWLNFISSELHKSFGPLFRPTTPDAYKAISKENIGKRLDFVDQQLAGKDYLMGTSLTVADAYGFAVVGWSKLFDISLEGRPNLTAYMARIGARPKVQAALKAEGLLK